MNCMLVQRNFPDLQQGTGKREADVCPGSEPRLRFCSGELPRLGTASSTGSRGHISSKALRSGKSHHGWWDPPLASQRCRRWLWVITVPEAAVLLS